MSHVFISYSRRDASFARRLHADLQANGIEVWADIDINPGTDWRTSLQNALMQASAIIVILSPDSMQSQWVYSEFTSAQEHGKRIFPVLIRQTDIPIDISHYQYIDFRNNYQLAFRRLLGAIKSSWDAKDTEPPIEEKDYVEAEEPSEPVNKGYVFLSYMSEDADFIERFKIFLKFRDYAFWDYRESERDYNMELYRELEVQIEEATVFVSVLSESWRNTPWTARELVYAEEAQIPVFVIQAKSLRRPVPILINLRTRIDMSTDYTKGIGVLSEEFDKKGL